MHSKNDGGGWIAQPSFVLEQRNLYVGLRICGPYVRGCAHAGVNVNCEMQHNFSVFLFS